MKMYERDMFFVFKHHFMDFFDFSVTLEIGRLECCPVS